MEHDEIKNEIADISQQEDLTALKNFLLDIECLDPLSEWTSRFNLFDILKISKVEIRHSNMLAWLIDPNENHGLGDSIIRGFIQYVVTSYDNDSDVFDTLLMDYHGFFIQREWHHIDLLAVSANEKFVMCIENKIDSGEHDDQLERYRQIVEEAYPNYKKIFIFLSPDGIESSDPDHWFSMSYQDVLDIIENARKKIKILPYAELLIDNYTEIIRRDIVEDEKLAQICAEIYSKHQKALDLIFENKPDRAFETACILKEWAVNKTKKGELEVDLNKCAKRLIRFKTKLMSELFPDHEKDLSGWNTRNPYFYEIYNGDNGFIIKFVVSAKNLSPELKELCHNINNHLSTKAKKIKKDWQWVTLFSTKTSKFDEEISEDKIYEQLDKRFEEVRAFEDKVQSFLQS